MSPPTNGPLASERPCALGVLSSSFGELEHKSTTVEVRPGPAQSRRRADGAGGVVPPRVDERHRDHALGEVPAARGVVLLAGLGDVDRRRGHGLWGCRGRLEVGWRGLEAPESFCEPGVFFEELRTLLREARDLGPRRPKFPSQGGGSIGLRERGRRRSASGHRRTVTLERRCLGLARAEAEHERHDHNDIRQDSVLRSWHDASLAARPHVPTGLSLRCSGDVVRCGNHHAHQSCSVAANDARDWTRGEGSAGRIADAAEAERDLVPSRRSRGQTVEREISFQLTVSTF